MKQQFWPSCYLDKNWGSFWWVPKELHSVKLSRVSPGVDNADWHGDIWNDQCKTSSYHKCSWCTSSANYHLCHFRLHVDSGQLNPWLVNRTKRSHGDFMSYSFHTLICTVKKLMKVIQPFKWVLTQVKDAIAWPVPSPAFQLLVLRVL